MKSTQNRDANSFFNKIVKLAIGSRKWFLYGMLGLVSLVIWLAIGSHISHSIEQFIATVENQYQQWFNQQDTTNPIVLIPLAFSGGLIASISPCILALLPVNLSYIGTREITSRRDALNKASLFVLGVVSVLSLFGLLSSFAGAVMVDYRGYINIVVGAIILFMAGSLQGWFKLPLPTANINLPQAGPYGVGLTFALVSSPCASPVLLAVLAAAGATGSQLLATVTMVSYALGYTLVIFVTSLATGLAKQARNLLNYSESIVKVGSIALLLAGGYYIFEGVKWFLP